MSVNKFALGLIATLPMVLAAAFFTGCEETGKYSRTDTPDTLPHETLKPPIIEDGEPDLSQPELMEYRGTVVESTEMLLQIDAENGARHDFIVTPDTQIRLNDTVAGLADLVPGQTVVIQALVEEDKMTAREITATGDMPDDGTVPDDDADDVDDADDAGEDEAPELPVTGESRVEGTIDSITESLTLIDHNEITHVFKFMDETRFTVDGEEATKADLRAGQYAVVHADADSQATVVDARNIK